VLPGASPDSGRGTRSPGRSRHEGHTRCARALATTDRVRTDERAGPQDEPEYLSANRVAPGRRRSSVGNDCSPTSRTMKAAARATWVGLAVLDQRGRWIGTVQRVHLNHTTGQPEWITVRAGRWVTTRHIAPLAGSSLRRRGVQLPYNRCAVHQAPEILDPDRMDLGDQFALYSHYLQSVAARSH
jgi:sporulation protein YlmC with PRC-barrel domain